MPHYDINVFQLKTMVPLYTSFTCIRRNFVYCPAGQVEYIYTMARDGRFDVYMLQAIYVIRHFA